MPIPPSVGVELGIQIADLLAEADVSASDCIRITMSLATFAAVGTGTTEEQFINYCRAAYRNAMAQKEKKEVDKELTRGN